VTIYKARRQIIGVYPTERGFGFAVFEARGQLADSGVARLYPNNDDEFVMRIAALIDKYNPALMLFEDTTNTTRGEKARRQIERAVEYAGLRDVRVLLVSRGDVRQALNLPKDATNYQVAEKVSDVLPELKQRLPDKPKPWQSDDERMALFAATGLGLVALR
jgi:hypothetical protein